MPPASERLVRTELATEVATASARSASARGPPSPPGRAIASTRIVAMAAVATARNSPIRASRAVALGSAGPAVASLGSIVSGRPLHLAARAFWEHRDAVDAMFLIFRVMNV